MKMQRQSLGSPGSNRHHHTAVNDPLTTVTESLPDSKPPSFNSDEDDEKTKLMKSSVNLKENKSPEKIIHAIPILTFVCFLILFLSSHEPSQVEMDAFGGAYNKRLETTAFIGARSGNGEAVVVANGSRMRRRELREEGKIRVHRKFGDFGV